MKRITMVVGVAALAAGISGTAFAADQMEPRTEEMVIFGPEPDISVQVGGGMHTYATELDKATDPGAALEVRGVYGLRQILGGEVAYIAGSNNLKDTPGEHAALASMGGEALLRANFGLKNFGVHTWEKGDLIPYIGAGGGFTTTGAVDNNGKKLDTVAGVNYKNSTAFHIPAAVGVEALIGNRFTVGARLGYKYEFQNQVRTDLAKVDVQSWQATGRVGWAF